MKKKIYDYSKLRPSTLISPQYRHLLLLLGWVWYLAMYVLTERLIPESRCHEVHCVVDDWIPFVEYFVIIYVAWYIYVVGSLAYFLFFDVESFKRLQMYIIVTQVVAVIIYIVWPSVQYLRPSSFEHQNFCTWLLQIIYTADTPTGVCPSLHVGYSLGVASAWWKRKDTKPGVKIGMLLFALLVCLAVSFVKQHSFVDVVVAIPVCVFAELIAFGPKYWMPRVKCRRGNGDR